MHLHFLLLQKWPQSPWIDSQADDIGKWKEPWLSHIAYRGHFFRFRHPYLHWTGIFDLLWDSPNVPFMGHCLWSQSHFIHDFRLHANVLHIHAFQDQHQQKQSKVLLKWMLGSPESMIFLPPLHNDTFWEDLIRWHFILLKLLTSYLKFKLPEFWRVILWKIYE